ncbi:MAG TPA: NAD(P)H-hydrate epimerase, partial [Clostridiales bacterium]|nr:NAD(P)H-hydrate epimerase [Clostridiales bacterium]
FLSQLGLFIEKTRLEQALKAGRDRLYSLAESAPVGFISCDVNGAITYANRKLLEILDSPSLEATRQINLLKFPLLQDAGFTDRLKECMEKDRIVKHEMGYRSKWGRESWLVVHMTPTKEEGQLSGASIVLDDVTETKKIQDDLKEKVYLDSLTLAYNRRVLDTLLQERLETLAGEGKVGCIGVLDVDDFKRINDHYGHKAGDGVLKYLAMRARKALREQDLVIRTGGDEFLVYLHDVGSEEGAHHAMERVLQKINGRYRLDDGKGKKLLNLNVTSSMGIAFFPKDGHTVEELMAQADVTLYQIKNGVKGVARSSEDPKATLGAVSCDEMKKLDAYAIETVGIPAIALMEQASLKVFEHIDTDRYRSVGIFCGTGNNGGDGLAVARHCLLAGMDVRVFVLGDPAKCSAEFRTNDAILHNLGCDAEVLQAPQELDRTEECLSGADLLVDALLGTGLSREVKDLYAEMIRRMNASGIPVLSVDIPSGLNGDTGQVMGEAVRAHKTVTFHRMKLGLLLNPVCTGEVVVERIGIPD